MSLRKQDTLWFGLSCIALAGVIAACGYILAPRSFEKTTGIITHTVGVPGGESRQDSQRVTYTYSVAGVDHTGRGIGRLQGIPESWRRVGGAIPVYFDRDSPASSYPFSPPVPWRWVGGAVIFAAMGIAAIVAGWPH